jgi:hypothetical protein
MALARLLPARSTRSSVIGGLDEYLNLFSEFGFQGHSYTLPSITATKANELAANNNAPVASCLAVRVKVFSEVRFQFQQFSAGRPTKLFGSPSLGILETPWPGGSTSDLLAIDEVDVSVFGNSYWIRPTPSQLVRLDPRHTLILTGDLKNPEGQQVGKQLIGYGYQPDKQKPMAIYLPGEVAHDKETPDVDNPFRGTSWLRAVLEDVDSDLKMTAYKGSFLKNAATPNLTVSLDPGVSPEAFEAFVDKMDAQHKGVLNAFKTLYLGGGADVKVVGSNFQQLDMKSVQGAGETRVAAAAGVPASIVGFSEGLAGSSLNAGNYTAARRRFADGTMRPRWRTVAEAFRNLVPVPAGSRLWYDDRDVSFLQEDVKDAADIMSQQASTIETLIRAGYEPATAAAAVLAGGDWELLAHLGLYSVQLQPPGAQEPAPPGGTP